MINFFLTRICWVSISFLYLFFLEEELIISSCLKANSSISSLSFISSSLPLRENLHYFHDSYVISWLVGILTLVRILIFRFYLTNFTSKNFVANFRVELGWIIFPSFILLGIGIPRIDFLYKLEEGEKDNLLTFKRFGYQWFWTYERPVSSLDWEESLRTEERYMIRDGTEDIFNYLSSDVGVNVPNYTPLINLVSARDVIHRWALPSLITKADAIPGRLNSLSFEFNSLCQEIHYGQCSELCGANHRFIPIVVKIH